ncbi:alpha/beta hydrolase [Variovorax ureilyticus]|uniref:alpha/beta hydrolase n=1 Tax=Variovorax ureilyticus TaxID=1836198 RepID=UPI003D67F73B
MVSRLLKFLKWTALVLVIVFVTAIALRTYDVQRGPPLERWHTFVPHELSQDELRKADWAAYIAAENKAFDEVRAEVTEKTPPEAQVPSNRYYKNSPIYPGRFAQDWNRSYILEPDGAPRGAVVLLHGLTDSPYSLRHVARLYRDRGYVVVAIRMPGHGTVPAGLTKVDWEDWSEATRLAVREARRRVPAPLPLHVVGFSNGGALAMKFALDGLDDQSLARPDRVILIAPMIGITELSRFAGVFGWPAIFPAFAKAAWLGIVPEFNPFKYNSFPVNGARQSSLLTRDLRAHIAREESAGKLAKLPPILTFQSLIDFTVSTRAIVTGLYSRLPANGSELVLFDLNRSIKFGPLLRSGSDLRLDRILPAAPRNFPLDHHHQHRAQQPAGGRARHRSRRDRREDAHAGSGVSAGGVLALAPRTALPDERFALRHAPGEHRRVRRQSRRACGAGRAGCVDREPRFADAAVVESVLSLYGGSDRRGHSNQVTQACRGPAGACAAC